MVSVDKNTPYGLAIINTKAPYGSGVGKDALDIALIFGSFEQKVSLFFIADGVFQLIDNQDGQLINIKDYLKTFSAFEFYDIEEIYVCQQSLLDRNLSTEFHIDDVTVLTQQELTQALKLHQHVLKF